MGIAYGESQSAAPSSPQSRSAVIRRAGLVSWSGLGIIALAAVVATALSALSGILIPLVIAVILGIVLEPISEALQRVRFPAVLATMVTLLAVVAVGAATIAIVVRGFVDQWPEIYRQLVLGWTSLVEWAAGLDIETQWLVQVRSALEGHAPQLGQGILGAITSTFYGALSLAFGTFFALFFLFFALRDASRFPAWLARTTSLDVVEVDTVISLTRDSVRGYFKGTAITALVTAPVLHPRCRGMDHRRVRGPDRVRLGWSDCGAHPGGDLRDLQRHRAERGQLLGTGVVTAAASRIRAARDDGRLRSPYRSDRPRYLRPGVPVATTPR